MTGGFLLAVLAAVLAIVVAAPKYAEPAVAAAPNTAVESEPILETTLDDEGLPVEVEVMTSRPPSKLKGYRWPVRGGFLDTFYGRHGKGRFEIDGKRIHDGIVITWFEGAMVKAAHSGTVVDAGRGWARHVGYDGMLDEVYERLEERQAKDREKGKAVERYPRGVVIDDGNGYYSVYTELKNLRVKAGDKVKAGQAIGQMSLAEGKAMMRYRLVRMDGPMMKVHESDRKKGYARYARERVDPLAVLKVEAKRRPKRADKAPEDTPRLSDYRVNPPLDPLPDPVEQPSL